MKRQIRNKVRFSRYYVLGIPVVLFILLNVYWAIEAASFGARLVVLEQKAHELQKENSILSSRLVSATSLGQLSQKTQSAGFAKPTNIVYITDVATVAKLP